MARLQSCILVLAAMILAVSAQTPTPTPPTLQSLRLGHVYDASYIPSQVAPSCAALGLLPTPLPAVNTLVVVSSKVYNSSAACGQCVRFRASDPSTQGGNRPVPSTWSSGLIVHENATYGQYDMGTGIPFTTAFPISVSPSSKSIEWQYINCPGKTDPALLYITSPDPTPASANAVTLSGSQPAVTAQSTAGSSPATTVGSPPAATPQPQASSQSIASPAPVYTAAPTPSPTQAAPVYTAAPTPYPTDAAPVYTAAPTPYPTEAAPVYTAAPTPYPTQPPQTPAPTQPASQSQSSFTGDQRGVATFYGSGSDSGSWCKGNTGLTGYPGLPTVALNGVQFGASQCNRCVLVCGTGSGVGTTPLSTACIKYTINNICPECPAGALDLALNGDGIWGIQWSFVDCGGKRKNSRKVLDVEASEVFDGVLTYNKQFQIMGHAAEQQ